MLTFVGLGLYDERSITVEGRDAIRDADRVFMENYTSKLVGTTVEALETYHDAEIDVRDRAGVEGDPEPILDAAETNMTVFLVVGDPMVSTTHTDLRLRAHERDIDTRIVHCTTAQTAASSLTGLQNYRFGKATTVPFAYGTRPVPESVLETIRENRDRGLHTLCYLDIKAEKGKYLTASAAAARLATDLDDALGVVVARAGGPDPLVVADTLPELADGDFGDPLHLLVIPGDLHHLEREFITHFI